MKKLFLSLFVICLVLPLSSCSEKREDVAIETVREPVKTAETKLSPQSADFEYYKFKDKYVITARNVQDAMLEVTIVVPRNYSGRQVVKSLNYSVLPHSLIHQDESDVAVFEIKNPKTKTTIELSGEAGVLTYDLSHAQKSPLKESLSPAQRSRYLSEEKFIEVSDRQIQAEARKLKANTQIDTVRNIYYFVQSNMRYDASKDAKGAKAALNERKGKCMDYASLMVALCRADNIPARVISGHMIRGDNTSHSWVEVYFDEYGWVIFEPTIVANFKPDFAESPNKYLTLGADIASPVTVKLKVTSSDNKPRPKIILMLEEFVDFWDSKTNKHVE